MPRQTMHNELKANNLPPMPTNGVTHDVTENRQNGVAEIASASGGRRGGPTNLRHGLRGLSWPAGTATDRRLVWQLKRVAAEAVQAAGGSLDLATCSLLETLADAERH